MPSRRDLLTATAGIGATALAGCSGDDGPAKDAIVGPVEYSQKPYSAVSVVYEDVTNPEKEMLHDMLHEGFFHACPEIPEKVRRFADRFEDPDSAYFEYDAQVYAIRVRVKETVYASTAKPPEDVPSC